MDTITEIFQPQNWQQLFLMAASIIVLGVARELASCIIRRLQNLETMLDRNTRETIRGRREAEKAYMAAHRATKQRKGDECPELQQAPSVAVGAVQPK